MLSKERIIDTFIKLVKIDSPSGEEKQIADYLVEHFKDRGLEVSVDNAGEKFGGNAGNIVAYLKGNSNVAPITFCAHMDQVSPCRGVNPIIDGNIIRVQSSYGESAGILKVTPTEGTGYFEISASGWYETY